MLTDVDLNVEPFEDDLESSPLRRMVWVFPDRESTRAAPKWQKAFWHAYQEVATELGLTWARHAPEDIAVDCQNRDDPLVYVAGERVTPADTLFVTSLYSLPYQAMDVFNQYALYAVLEHGGFYLPAPPRLSAIVNDKLATILYLKDAPIPAIPTVRIGTGRDLGYRHYEPVLREITFPAIVKPTGWCAGWGICMAHNLEDLHGMLSLAQGGETTIAIQPYLGRHTIDFRVFMVDGKPHTVARRTPPAESYVANFGRGGGVEYVPLPTELADAMDYFAERIPIPFVCVDFLFDGEKYWFSEIEPDGAIVCPDHDSPAVVRRQRSIIEARFRAYRRGHARWLGPVSAHETKEV
jgi:glutathione synthase/RimK-type ligase-like ATP-grasp enzyme